MCYQHSKPISTLHQHISCVINTFDVYQHIWCRLDVLSMSNVLITQQAYQHIAPTHFMCYQHIWCVSTHLSCVCALCVRVCLSARLINTPINTFDVHQHIWVVCVRVSLSAHLINTFVAGYTLFCYKRAGSVLESDVRLNSVSFHKEYRKETGKHGQIIILGQFEISRWWENSPSKCHFPNILSFARTGTEVPNSASGTPEMLCVCGVYVVCV